MDNYEHIVTSGGNATVVNGDEKAVLDACLAAVPIQVVGFQADDSHVSPQFREPGIDGA